jgi:MoaA/NifB/PqqE/SkfB family radical SAM enzyme
MTGSGLAYQTRYLTKGARLLRRFVSGQPFLCNWQITYRCNFKCSICSFWREPHSREDELSLDQVRQVAVRLRPHAPLVLSMAGGEPLLRHDLPEVTALLARDHFFSLITNGWLVTRELADRLYEAGLQDIHVSIDYASPERHDAQRGVKGAFDRAVRAVQLLREARPDRKHRVHIMAVLLDDNVEELEGLLLLAEELGVSLEVSLYSHRRGQKPIRVPEGEVVSYLRELRRRHRGTFVSFGEYLEGFDEAVARAGGVPGCHASRTFFNIDNRGRVARCIDLNDHPVGSLLDHPLEHLLEDLRRQAEEDPCDSCWTSCRGFGDIMTGPLGAARSISDFVQAIRPL